MGIHGAYTSYSLSHPFKDFSAGISNLLGDIHHEVLVNLYTVSAIKAHPKRETNTGPHRYETVA